jgi:hypothetical protein
VDFVQFPRKGRTRLEVIFPSERPYREYQALRGAPPLEASIAASWKTRGRSRRVRPRTEGRCSSGRSRTRITGGGTAWCGSGRSFRGAATRQLRYPRPPSPPAGS